MTTCCECGAYLWVGYIATIKIKRKRFDYSAKEKASQDADKFAFDYELSATFSVCKDCVEKIEKRLNMRDIP